MKKTILVGFLANMALASVAQAGIYDTVVCAIDKNTGGEYSSQCGIIDEGTASSYWNTTAGASTYGHITVNPDGGYVVTFDGSKNPSNTPTLCSSSYGGVLDTSASPNTCSFASGTTFANMTRGMAGNNAATYDCSSGASANTYVATNACLAFNQSTCTNYAGTYLGTVNGVSNMCKLP